MEMFYIRVVLEKYATAQDCKIVSQHVTNESMLYYLAEGTFIQRKMRTEHNIATMQHQNPIIVLYILIHIPTLSIMIFCSHIQARI